MLPWRLIYFEEFQRVDESFYREKQVQGWSRKTKEALINGFSEELRNLAECMNEIHYKNRPIRPRALRLRSGTGRLRLGTGWVLSIRLRAFWLRSGTLRLRSGAGWVRLIQGDLVHSTLKGVSFPLENQTSADSWGKFDLRCRVGFQIV